MKTILPIVLILFFLIPGCIQPSSETTGTTIVYSFPEAGFKMNIPESWNVSQTQRDHHLVYNSPDYQAWIGFHLYQVEEYALETSFDGIEVIQISGVNGTKRTDIYNNNGKEYVSNSFKFVQECPELQNSTITYHISYDYPKEDNQVKESLEAIFDSIELTCPSVNYYPYTGFKAQIPQSWSIKQSYQSYQVIFTSPDNQASIPVRIYKSYDPEDVEWRGLAMSYEQPNSTPIEFMKWIRISGGDGMKSTFFVNNPDRQYIEGIIGFAQKCPGREYNIIEYSLHYDYTIGDTQLEETINAMINSIELSCPSGN